MSGEKLKTEDVIKSTVINSIKRYASSKLRNNPRFQILDLLIPKERKIRSIVGGLETSLGTTLWEPLGRALASNNGFAIHNRSLQKPTHMPGHLESSLNTIINDRIQNGGMYNGVTSHSAIQQACVSIAITSTPAFYQTDCDRRYPYLL